MCMRHVNGRAGGRLFYLTALRILMTWTMRHVRPTNAIDRRSSPSLERAILWSHRESQKRLRNDNESQTTHSSNGEARLLHDLERVLRGDTLLLLSFLRGLSAYQLMRIFERVHHPAFNSHGGGTSCMAPFSDPLCRISVVVQTERFSISIGSGTSKGPRTPIATSWQGHHWLETISTSTHTYFRTVHAC